MFMKTYLRMSGNNNVLTTFSRNKYREFRQGNARVSIQGKRGIHSNPTSLTLIHPSRSNIIHEAQKSVGCFPLVEQMKLHFDESVDFLNLFLMKRNNESKQLHTLINDIIRNNYEKIEMWGLIVLLFSKAVNHLTTKNKDAEESAAIWKSQQELAIITQFLLTSNVLHENVTNIKENSKCDKATNVRNKMAILSGDYFLSQVFTKTARLKNTDLMVELSNTIKDMSEVEFIRRRNEQQDIIPPPPPKNCTDYAIKEWTEMHALGSASLLGKACQCAILVARNDNELQKQAYHFGKHYALALQACTDLVPFRRNDQINSLNLFSAPILFHIEYDPSILTEINKYHSANDNINYSKIFETVQSGPAIQLTKQLQKKQAQHATRLLSAFSENEATVALTNIIAAIMEDC